MAATKYSLAATAEVDPDRLAVIDAETGETVTFAELEDRSARIAALLAEVGLRRGDHIAIVMENNKRFMEIFWAGHRSGLYVTPVNWHLTVDEAHYVISDSGAKVLFTSAAVADLATKLPDTPSLLRRFSIDGPVDGFESLDDAIAAVPDDAEGFENIEGGLMLYSSGTTGRPKGILRPIQGVPFGQSTGQSEYMQDTYDVPDLVQLCSAPLYHAGPVATSMLTHRMGGTVVLMRNFDAENVLRLIERYRVTHAQFVPTMFVRLLKLPLEVREKFDLSSLTFVLHTAASCPVAVKEQMIGWWGKVIWEIYAGSEGNGACMVDSATWLQHKGTVGQPIGCSVHILDDAGNEVPTGEVGTIYFSGISTFEYHNDPDKTASSRADGGRSTLGDLGYVDDEGFVYISDRRTDLIISGGVNIYPREIEDVLLMHPKVLDVAVIGVANEEFGHEVKAIVQPADPATAGPALEAELIEYCRDRIAHFKCPRTVDFDDELPRLPNGKLLKRRLLDRYRPPADAVA